ncbi:hypothetical protein AOZ07_01480 [Glutamicibacter halophytocola]|uniref:hypothetical protein n=1 Tax=Glutamicibacter halophytocola TaxID=1933880 RepID=UPI0006D4BF2E|nr:hypothetical protein [Glutamicibacter halophytocola]ALG27799.1 hypothetical protein AOZ07_01480 [Glutamicibacter halophytocola]
MLNYQRQKEKRQKQGLPEPSAIEHEKLRTAISYYFGETTALFFDRHERLPYDRRSILGWPMTWLERQAINFWSVALSFAAWVLLFIYLPKISLIVALESPAKPFAHAAVAALCAGLLLRVLILLIQKFPPKNLEQRLSDYEELKQQRINEAKMRETAAAQERIDRLAEAEEQEIKAEQARAARLAQTSPKGSR